VSLQFALQHHSLTASNTTKKKKKKTRLSPRSEKEKPCLHPSIQTKPTKERKTGKSPINHKKRRREAKKKPGDLL